MLPLNRLHNITVVDHHRDIQRRVWYSLLVTRAVLDVKFVGYLMLPDSGTEFRISAYYTYTSIYVPLTMLDWAKMVVDKVFGLVNVLKQRNVIITVFPNAVRLDPQCITVVISIWFSFFRFRVMPPYLLTNLDFPSSNSWQSVVVYKLKCPVAC